jgi:protein-S-isoprenylcysteine O-methyltransferase Ste14
MFLRALFAFIAMPGIVAFAIPAVWLWRRNQLSLEHPLGLLLLAVGTAGLLWCVRDFYVEGKGTLAPWAPPQELVVVGLYRYSRNPMYVCVLLTLLGWAASFASMGLFTYTLLVAIAFHLRVVLGEEPWLSQTHGASWQIYKRQVPRWVGMRRNSD